MKWISGIARDKLGRPAVNLQSDGQAEVIADLTGLAPDVCISGGIRRQYVMKFSDLHAVPADDYLRGLGRPDLSATCQPVYELLSNGHRVLIPAQILVLASLAPFEQFRKVLLLPWGPRCLMTAFVDGGGLTVSPTPNRLLGDKLTQPTIARRLEWLLSYPSAEAAWGSVYRNALNQRFDMRLPAATARVTAFGHKFRENFLVTRLELMTLEPNESPNEFALTRAPSAFVFSDLANYKPDHGKAAAPSADARLIFRGPIERLSEEQWQRVMPVLLNHSYPAGNQRLGQPRSAPLRAVFETLLLKLSAPYSWSRVPREKRLVTGAKNLHHRLQLKHGSPIWEEILSALALQPMNQEAPANHPTPP